MGFHIVHSQKPSSVSVAERRKKELEVGGREEGGREGGREGGKEGEVRSIKNDEG